jgi:hypothetical protein
MFMAKDKKVKNLDEIFETEKLDEAFKAYDKTKESFGSWYADILMPAQDKLYDTIKTKLDKLFEGNNDAKLAGKKKEIQQAIVEGLKEYFNHAQPSILKGMEGMKDDEEQYEYLTHHYDMHVGAGKEGRGRREGAETIKRLLGYATNKKAKLADLKKDLWDQKKDHAEGALAELATKQIHQHFGKYHPVVIGNYLKPKLEENKFEIEDKIGYGNASIFELIGLRERAIKKKEIRYLGPKEEKEKE